MLRRLNQDLIKSLENNPDSHEDSPVKLEMTPDGLSINVFDRTHKPVFEPQSAKLTEHGNWVFATLAWEISRYTNFCIELEGHTEKGNPPPREDYGDWEISTERANIVRRKLIDNGVLSRQIKKIAGFGDTVPMSKEDPSSELNRRVTVLLNVKATGGSL